MAQDNFHPADDIVAMESALKQYPKIKICRPQGSSPDYCEIEYLLRGYTFQADETISQAEKHRISLSLSLGYPHLPPNVKPLTPIFHPDIEPDAVRIADFWEENKSLADLVVHIGKMICAETYNLSSPFNQQAAEWYVEHGEELPLDTLENDQRDDPVEPNPDYGNLTIQHQEKVPENDSQGDRIAEDQQTNLRNIYDLIENKKFFTADKLLKNLKSDINQEEVNQLSSDIAKVLEEAKRLNRDIKALEYQKKYLEAKAILDQLAQTVSDLPEFDNIKTRIRESIAVETTAKLAQDRRDAKDNEFKEFEKLIDLAEEGQGRKNFAEKKENPIAQYLNKILSTLPYKTIFFATLISVAILVGGKLFFKDKQNLDMALKKWQDAIFLYKIEKFRGAKQTAEFALHYLDKVIILRSEKNILHQSIKQLLMTKELIEGIEGRVFYRGNYLDAKLVEALKTVDTMIENGKALLDNHKHDEALGAFRSALHFAKNHDLNDQIAKINHRINQILLDDALGLARKAEQDQEWDNAAATYLKALQLARGLADQEHENVIVRQLAAANFRKEITESKEAFSASQWKKTIEILNRAQQLLQENPTAVSQEEKSELKRLQNNSTLYYILSQARQANEEHNWTLAIEQYEKGLAFLKNNKENFANNHSGNIDKIERTLLMIKISQEMSRATSSVEKKDLPAALVHYNNLIKLISTSKHNNITELKTILKNTQSQLVNLQNQLDINNKIAWLTKNYYEIFTKHYPSTKVSRLLHPKVKFIKRTGNKMIFNLKCIERNRNSSFRLELDYQYSPENDSWSMYSGPDNQTGFN